VTPCRPGWKKILIVCLYMTLLAFFSLAPMETDTQPFRIFEAVAPTVQNLAHFPAYGLLGVLWMQVLSRRGLRGPGRAVPAFLLGAGFGMATELAQFWIPGRYPSLTDSITNVLGVLIGLLVYLGVEKRSPGAIRRLVCD